MARGFLSGLVSGVAVAGVGLGTLSVVSGAPPSPEAAMTTEAEKVAAVTGAEAAADGAALPVSASQPDVSPEAEAPAAPEQADTVDALPDASGADTAEVDVTSDVPVMPAPQEGAESDAASASAALAPEAARPALDAAPEPVPAPVPEVDPEAEPEAEADPESSPDSGPDSGPAIGTPATVLTEREGAVTEQRLPSVGAADAPEAPAETVAPVEGQAALIANAADVDVPANLPRLAVVLIDDGSGPLGPEALQSLPFPVTFAIDPGHPDPAGTAAAYRALGFEVVVMADLPQGGAAADVEVALAGALAQVPQAVAVIEDPAATFGGDRATVVQVAQYLAASGHGLMMVPQGLNTAAQLAAREGVPAASVFRDFDAEGQDANTIRRSLDQAAFRARQDGSVVMLGRLRADTVSALLLWGLQDRSGSLALVPASTVLLEAAQ